MKVSHNGGYVGWAVVVGRKMYLGSHNVTVASVQVAWAEVQLVGVAGKRAWT